MHGLGAFPTFFKSEFCNKEFMIWVTVSSRFCFCWWYRVSPSLAIKIQSIWFQYWPSSDFHVQSHLLYCWKREFAMTSVFSWWNPASFCTQKPNLPVTPGISWLPTFIFQSPIMKRTYFLVLVLEGLVGLHRTIQLQLLQHYWLGHRLWLLWYWLVCLGNEQRSFCCFWDCTQVLHFRLFCWLWGLLHF